MKHFHLGFISLVLGLSLAQLNGSSSATDLQNAVTQESLFRHLETFQAVADANGGNRSAGSAGYDASVAYIQEQLEAAGFEVRLQPFTVESFDILEPAELRVSGEVFGQGDVATMTLSAAGEVTGRVQAVDVQLPPGSVNSSTSGCEASDFEGFVPGNVALLQRGTCTFQSKVEQASAAGASAVIVFNEGQPGRRDAFGGSLEAVSSLPVVSVSYALGQRLADTLPELHLSTQTLAETRTTHNLIAESRGGDDENVVMLGAHLDSVPNGPGIHDNGSGSAAILEIALQAAEVLGVNSEASSVDAKLRFAWWGAEELGLLGSRHYVESLSAEETQAVRAYLNLDMVGSPNFVRFVYDGDESDRSTSLPLPPGTAAIEEALLEPFAEQGLATTPVAVFSRSDHAAFAQAGIPVGGLFTGAEGRKTAAQAERYGGTVGAAYDSCYHRACDTLANVNMEMLEQMADAAAYALVVLSKRESAP